jgi:hypothetical protein
MSVQLVSRAVAEPEVNFAQRAPVVQEPPLRPRVPYDLEGGEDDQRVAVGRGIVVAVLLSAPVWILLGLTVYLVKW